MTGSSITVRPRLGGFEREHPWGFRSAEEWERREELVPEWTKEDEERLRARVSREDLKEDDPRVDHQPVVTQEHGS